MPLRCEIHALLYKTTYKICFHEKKIFYITKNLVASLHVWGLLYLYICRAGESKTTMILSVFMFQGTNVAHVLPQHFQKEHLSTSFSKFDVDLNYGYEHLQKKKKKKNQEQSFEGVSVHLSLCPTFKDIHYSHIRVVWCLPERKGDRKVGGIGNQTHVLLVQSQLVRSLDWIFQEWTSNVSPEGKSGEVYIFPVSPPPVDVLSKLLASLLLQRN